MRLISISFLISIFTFFHKNHGSIRHSRTMPPNASKTVFGEYPISHTHACSLTRCGSRKYPIASSSFSSLYTSANHSFLLSIPYPPLTLARKLYCGADQQRCVRRTARQRLFRGWACSQRRVCLAFFPFIRSYTFDLRK